MRIKLKYPDIETFIQKYAVNISRGGIFIATRTPKSVGTTVRFEFQLATAQPIIRGEGQVIWVKEFDPAEPRKVHGMGVQFTRLDPQSRSLIDQALAWKREHPQQGEEEGALRGEGTGEPAAEGGSVAPAAVPAVIETAAPITVPEITALTSPEEPPLLPPLQAQSQPVPTVPPAPVQHQVDSEAVAEMWQATESQIIRAARHIVELTMTEVYYPEDQALLELMQPLRIRMPQSGREASRLLESLLSGDPVP